MEFKEIIKALRLCTEGNPCEGCPFDGPVPGCADRLKLDAAATIEAMAAHIQQLFDNDQELLATERIVEEQDKKLADLQENLKLAQYDVDFYRNASVNEMVRAGKLEGERDAYRDIVHRLTIPPEGLETWEAEA